MKILTKIIKKMKESSCRDDNVKLFFKSEYKKDYDAAFWYWKTMNDLNYHQ